MSVTTSELIRISGKQRAEEKPRPSMRDARKKRPTLKELQEKKYPFPDSDLSGMLDDLLEKGTIELPPSKCPEESEGTNDPKYCRYHRVVSHPLEKCITLKERIMQLVKDGTIILDLEEAAEINHTTIWCEHCHLALPLIEELVTIQFGSLEPVMLSIRVPKKLVEAKLVPDILSEDAEGWTLVTRWRPKKQRHIKPPPLHRIKRQGRKKNSRCPKEKKRPKSDRKHEVQRVDLLEQERLLPVTLEEFFPRDFFRKVAVNMVSCSKLKDEDGEEDVQAYVQEAAAPSTDDKVLVVLKVLLEHISWKQMFQLPEEMHE